MARRVSGVAHHAGAVSLLRLGGCAEEVAALPN